MSDPVPFLTSFGQALATLSLYSGGHPARERAMEASYEQLLDLLQSEPRPRFSFLDGEVVFGQLVLRELKDWDWGIRLAKATVQRVEFTDPVSREEYQGFLSDVFARLNQAQIETAEARQLNRTSIRFGPIGVRGSEELEAMGAVATATIAYTLNEEVETIRWVHDQVESTGGLPLLEAEAVVRSLSLAMHSESQVVLPLLQLKEFDQYTATHSSNVAVLSMALSEFLGLGPRDVRAFGQAGLLHDLGKIRIPKEILVKPGEFTEQEREVMRRHPVEGARIILEREKKFDLAAVVAYEHHIMLDGTGYPTFRFERDCHYASKLVHVCDVYDALCTKRPYRDAWHSEMALAYLDERSGIEFDAGLSAAFATMMRQWSHQRVAVPEPTSTAA
ncbi:MAG: HD-GYP domain-containing protein [Gemmatimonadales bacterium]